MLEYKIGEEKDYCGLEILSKIIKLPNVKFKELVLTDNESFFLEKDEKAINTVKKLINMFEKNNFDEYILVVMCNSQEIEITGAQHSNVVSFAENEITKKIVEEIA